MNKLLESICRNRIGLAVRPDGKGAYQGIIIQQKSAKMPLHLKLGKSSASSDAALASALADAFDLLLEGEPNV